MSNLENNLYKPAFSHIYIEKEAYNHPNTEKIIKNFPKAELIEINHYKDVFCRKHQNYRLQKQSWNLILARKSNTLLYEGAPVCQNFGNHHFYYTSSVMNCIYDCEYCYLQGMYPSANLVVFVNLEDIFSQVKILLKKHPVYLCVSYDTDLMALEHVLGYVKEWFHFALEHPDLTIEIRTKSANMKILDELKPLDNVILAWTLSPQGITEKMEHHTPTLKQRLECIHKAVQIGFQVRLCFDPMLYCPDWKREYQGMIDTVFDQIPADRIKDVSTGVFRVSQDYMKQMRKQAPYSSIIQFPFENDVGVYHYSKELSKNMVTFIVQLLSRTIPKENIFIWNEVSE